MAKLYFKVEADFDKVQRLRDEISKLKAEMASIDANKQPDLAKSLSASLSTAQTSMRSFITEAASAGVAVETNLKQKIYQSSISVNELTQKMIDQKSVIKQVESDVRNLSNAYRSMSTYNAGKGNSLLELNSAKKVLIEEKTALFDLQQQQASARLSVKGLKDEYALFKNESKGVVVANGGMAISFKQMMASIGGLALLNEFKNKLIDTRAEFQRMDMAIETMLGSKEKSDKLLTQVKAYAAISPLTVSDLTAATQMMLGFNLEVEKVPKFLQALGDVSMGDSQKFNSLTLAFSQSSAAGKLMGQDLNQMINAGFNPLQIIAQKTGKSIADLKKEMEKGAISTEMVQQAFIDATSEGGRFYKMAENGSKTISGQLSMLQDSTDNAFNSLGKNSEGIIMMSIQGAKSIVDNYEEVGKVLIGLIGTYGAYRVAVVLASNAEAGHSIATMFLRDRIILLRKAQALLNTTMLSNPYVAAAVALGVLATAAWAMYDSTTAAEKAQKSFNEEMDKLNQAEEEHKNKIEALISTASNEVLSTQDRKIALIKLRDAYPSIFAKYKTEADMLRDILKIKNQINESDRKKTQNNATDKVTYIDNKISQLQKEKASGSSNPMVSPAAYSKGIDDQIAVLKEKRKLYTKKIANSNTEEYLTNLTGISNSRLKSEIETRKRLLANMGSGGKKYGKVSIGGAQGTYTKDELESQLNTLTLEKNARDTPKKTANQWVEDNRKAMEAAKSKLDNFVKSKNTYSKEEYDKLYKQYDEDYKTAKEKYEKGGGVSSKDAKSAASKAARAAKEANEQKAEIADRQIKINEYTEAISKSVAQSENEIEQSHIDAMENGAQKEEAQIALNYQKLITANTSRRDEMVKQLQAKEKLEWENKNPKAKEKGLAFTPTSTENNLTEDQKKVLQGYTDSANTYKEKAEKDLLKNMLAEFMNYEAQKEAISKKYDDKIADLNSKKGSDPVVNAKIDASIGEANKSKNNELSAVSTEQFKKSINFEDVFGDLDKISTKSIGELKTKIQEYLKLVQGKISETDFKQLSDAFKNLEKEDISRAPAITAVGKAYDDYKASCEKVATAQKALNKLQESGTGDTEEQRKATKALTDAQKDQAVSKAALNKTVNNLGSNMKATAEAGQDILSGLNDLGIETSDQVSGIIAGYGKVADGLAEIDFTKPMSIITGSAKVLSGFASVIGSALGGSEKVVSQKLIDSYEALTTVISNLLDKQTELLEKQSGSEAVESAQKSIELIKQEIQSARNMANETAKAGSSWKSHSYAYHINKNTDWNELSEKMGFRLNNINDVINLSADKLQQNSYVWWSSLDSSLQTYLQKIIDTKDQLSDLDDTLNEALTGISFDSTYDSFESLLQDMSSDSSDFAKNFEEDMRNAIIRMMMTNTYEDKLKAWYKKFAEYTASNDKLTADEITSLNEEYTAIVQAAVQERDDLLSAAGIDSSSTQSSTSGGFASASQESTDELNGRFAALQMSGEEIKDQNVKQTDLLNSVLTVSTAHCNIADETRTIAVNSFLELREISLNTANTVKQLVASNEFLKDIKTNTSKL